MVVVLVPSTELFYKIVVDIFFFLSHEKLNDLAILSIERKLVRNVSFENLVNNFVKEN